MITFVLNNRTGVLLIIFLNFVLFSLNDDIHQNLLTMSDNGNTSSVKNQLDNMDKQILMKKKRRYKHSSSTSDKRQRRYRHKEGIE
jgi:hypothetical protein